MSLIFMSLDRKLYCSIICKNTFKFNEIENMLYEDYTEYAKTENFFTVNGCKINKYKTLEENKIHNNDVINYFLKYNIHFWKKNK